MTTYVALLRGINVGGRTLKMDALRTIAAGCGCAGVQTYIQSGNVVFTSRKGAARVGTELHDAILDGTGIDTTVVVRTAAQLQGVLDANPWPDRVTDPTKVSVGFLYDTSRPTLDAVDPATYAPDEVVVVGIDAYLSTPNGMGKSKLVEPMMKRLGIQGTVRNWRTVMTLAEMATAV
ncbi:MAG: DUF1697 domain-containing protein [Acidimicrobiia bacterium]|nr:DUF1697 domain-containing protein [Acidimicrobiia bacterium]